MNGWTKEQVTALTSGTSTNDAKIDGLAGLVREAAANSGSVTDATWKAAQQAGWSDERLADAFAYLGTGPRFSDKKVRPDRRPDGRRNEQPIGGRQTVLAEKCLLFRRCSLSHRLPGVTIRREPDSSRGSACPSLRASPCEGTYSPEGKSRIRHGFDCNSDWHHCRSYRVRRFPLSNPGICSLRVSCDIHVKSHWEQNHVAESQRNLRTASVHLSC
jgi:hypothetical protein